jgi:hypothetical protein
MGLKGDKKLRREKLEKGKKKKNVDKKYYREVMALLIFRG